MNEKRNAPGNVTETEEPVIEGTCPFKHPITRKVCGAPLIYNQKYDTVKCSIHNHYAMDRKEFERREGLKE